MLFPVGCGGVWNACASGINQFALKERGERNPSGQVSCSWLCGAARTTTRIRVFSECHGEAVFGEGRLGTAGSGIQRLWPENSDLLDESKRWLTLQLGAWGAFVPSFCKYLLSTYYVPGSVRGSGDTVVIEMYKVSSVMELTFQCCGVGLVTNNEQINMQCVAHDGNFKKK